MSVGQKRPIEEATELARNLQLQFAPHCTRTKIVGSVRRRRPFVGDIELLVEPMTQSVTAGDLFNQVTRVQAAIAPLRRVGDLIGNVVKAGERYMQVQRADGFNLDVFICHPLSCECETCRKEGHRQWGSLEAIRTGPGNLGKASMIMFQRRGLKHHKGQVFKACCPFMFEGGCPHKDPPESIPVPDEETFFKLAGIEFVLPWKRDELFDDVNRFILERPITA